MLVKDVIIEIRDLILSKRSPEVDDLFDIAKRSCLYEVCCHGGVCCDGEKPVVYAAYDTEEQDAGYCDPQTETL